VFDRRIYWPFTEPEQGCDIVGFPLIQTEPNRPSFSFGNFFLIDESEFAVLENLKKASHEISSRVVSGSPKSMLTPPSQAHCRWMILLTEVIRELDSAASFNTLTMGENYLRKFDRTQAKQWQLRGPALDLGMVWGHAVHASATSASAQNPSWSSCRECVG
jgi:hypothetical protein